MPNERSTFDHKDLDRSVSINGRFPATGSVGTTLVSTGVGFTVTKGDPGLFFVTLDSPFKSSVNILATLECNSYIDIAKGPVCYTSGTKYGVSTTAAIMSGSTVIHSGSTYSNHILTSTIVVASSGSLVDLPYSFINFTMTEKKIGV